MYSCYAIEIGFTRLRRSKPNLTHSGIPVTVTKDGQVKAADALNILKIAVKFSTAPEMEWLSLPKSVGSESMSRTYVVWPNSPIPVTLDMDQDVNLIGIVKDDVDGSWSAVG